MRQKAIRQGGNVTRWHTVQHINRQTVASHSWGVAAICLDLWEDCSLQLLKAAIYHDIGEGTVGDIPSPARKKWLALGEAMEQIELEIKTQLGVNFELSNKDKNRLRWADILELLWFCIEEIETGNTSFREVFKRGLSYTQELGYDQEANRMLSWMRARML